MIIVADSSALIALAACNGLQILLVLFDEVFVPKAVYDEVVQPNKPFASDLGLFLENRIIDVNDEQILITVGSLGDGEIEAMALYRQLDADRLLIDDRRAKKVAEANQINCIGTLGLLLLAKNKKNIPEISSYIDLLRLSSIRFSPKILERALLLAGEIKTD